MDEEIKPGMNGMINLAKRIPEFLGKIANFWVRAPEFGPEMYRSVELPPWREDHLPQDTELRSNAQAPTREASPHIEHDWELD